MAVARTKLVQYRTSTVTTDVTEAMRKLEARAHELGNVRIGFQGTSKGSHLWDAVRTQPGPTRCKPEWSMVPTGREVYLSLHFTEDEGEDAAATRRERELATLWGLAIPLGFTPFTRHPLPGDGDDVFHFLGPWRTLYDHLTSVFRGEEAWPSVACAAQSDVGAWQGVHPMERFVQAQLHRIGINIGPVDGIMGDVTTEGIRRAGLHGMPLDKVAEGLLKMQLPEPPPNTSRIGHVVVPGKNLSIVCFGQVTSTRTPTGATLDINGPGRVVVDIT